MVHEEEVQDSAYPGYDFTTVEGNRAKLAKGKGAWGGGVVQRKQDANFQEPLPEDPQGELMPPALGCENTCEMLSPSRGPQRLGAQGLYQGLVMQEHSAWHVPKFQTPRRKAGLQPKARCLHDRSGNVSCSYQLEPSPNPSSQRTAKAKLASRPFKGQQSQAYYVNVCLHHPLPSRGFLGTVNYETHCSDG